MSLRVMASIVIAEIEAVLSQIDLHVWHGYKQI